jgi:hypothetical protein
VLLGITASLRAHHTKIVVLRASNPLDMMFLTRYLRQYYPQGRLVTMGADLLFRREIEDDVLHGIMAVTSYSLLPREDEETTGAGATAHVHLVRVFASSDEAGAFNAMLSLLVEPRALHCYAKDNSEPDQCALKEPADYTELGWPRIAVDTETHGDRWRRCG